MYYQKKRNYYRCNCRNRYKKRHKKRNYKSRNFFKSFKKRFRVNSLNKRKKNYTPGQLQSINKWKEDVFEMFLAGDISKRKARRLIKKEHKYRNANFEKL